MSLGTVPGTGAGSPKFSDALDAVPDEDVVSVIEACEAALKADSLEPLQKLAPEVAAAALANSNHRRKPLTHSLKVAIARLTARSGG